MAASPYPLPLHMPPPSPPPLSDACLLSSLLRLSRELSLADLPGPIHRRATSSLARKCSLLTLLFEDLCLQGDDSSTPLPRPAALALREILAVLRRMKALLADLSARSRARVLLEAEPIAGNLHELSVDLATLLDLLPLHDLPLSADAGELVDLASRQCSRSSPAVDSSDESLRREILDLIRDIEGGIVPDRSKLGSIFRRLGLDDSGSCRGEIERIEREICDRVAENWISAMVALVGLVRYAKCVLYGTSTPRSEPGAGNLKFSAVDLAIPSDFQCPISLDLMRDPVVVASGQTYDRESISRWIASGHATCPKTGQALANTDLVPNRALKNLIVRWCREQHVPFEAAEASSGEPNAAVASNKAALEAARMTASFLAQRLAASPLPDAANRIVYEIRQLAKIGADNRAFIAEAGAIPLLLPLLRSDDPSLQLNAVTALLNLSILDGNKKRIMHAEGGVNGIVEVMGSGATWQAKENAAATLLSLSSNHAYRRRLGRNLSIVELLVRLVKEGPTSTKKDALAAILSLAGDRENVERLVTSGVVETALDAVAASDVAEEAAAVLAAVAKRGGAVAIAASEGSIRRLVGVLKGGSDWARESAAAALVLVCRRAGGKAVAELAAFSGIEWAIWELMASGTDRARRKAAALGRVCRRWLAAEEADRMAGISSISISIPTITEQA